jgi:hypothetical protein
MKNLSLKAKLILLVGCAVTNLVVFGVKSFTTLSSVEVGSPAYNLIVMIKDVNADFVPPTQSLAVGVVHAVKMEKAPDAATTTGGDVGSTAATGGAIQV